MWQRYKIEDPDLEFTYALKPDPSKINVYVSNVDGYNNPTENSYLLMTEPPEIFEFSPHICSRYKGVIGPEFFHESAAPNHITSPPLLPNFVGVKFPKPNNRLWSKFPKSFQGSPQEVLTVKEIQNSPSPARNVLSVIVSEKKWTPLQRKRLEFAHFLKSKRDVDIEFFGENGMIRDKYDSLKNSKWSLAIENSVHSHYFSEKLTDGVLSGSHSFYFGAPNVGDYFTTASFTSLQLENFEEDYLTIRTAMQNSKSGYDFTDDKKRLLEEYSLEGWFSKNLNLIV